MAQVVEYFEHTADLGLRVIADDPSALFRAGAEGLFGAIVADRGEVEPRESESVELQADDLADLWLGWLNELIFRSETRQRLYSRFEVAVADDLRSLRATIAGEAIDDGRHHLEHEVKAATRHGLVVERKNGGWKAEVVLDI